jgi:hypothetical protein
MSHGDHVTDAARFSTNCNDRRCRDRHRELTNAGSIACSFTQRFRTRRWAKKY